MGKDEERKGTSYIEKVANHWYRIRNFDMVGKLYFDIREVQSFSFKSSRVRESEEYFTVILTLSLKSGDEIKYILEGAVSFDLDEENDFIILETKRVLSDLDATREYLEKLLVELD